MLLLFRHLSSLRRLLDYLGYTFWGDFLSTANKKLIFSEDETLLVEAIAYTRDLYTEIRELKIGENIIT